MNSPIYERKARNYEEIDIYLIAAKYLFERMLQNSKFECVHKEPYNDSRDKGSANNDNLCPRDAVRKGE